MAVTVSVLYPNEPDAKYDVDYYVNKHMPLAGSTWKDFGVKSWSVIKYAPGPDGTEPKYAFAGVLQWDSLENVKKALAAPETAKVMQDVPNYSNKQPVFLIGDEVKAVTV
ncbi:ethyl tert-butyl ether degradation [Colletotrichum truncatum]|uniref:Ethyl tert-butyl ether degradation n=1 Tax=Colletotrichum truncatum TaxID=5467 RepID=A0ACC3YHT3_COLTU|nr:ethyl tert-butyl ether degradation [Colletotrichum truncatum]KAF6785982.1 ethyl tert-butyl ether degradation [Colletotrichum truncatum]